VLTVKAGVGDEPLIIVGVVVAYLVALLMSAPPSAGGDAAERSTGTAEDAPEMGAPAPETAGEPVA